MIDYQIAIPSYKRPQVVCEGTLSMLERYGVDPDRVTVFVASTEEYLRYRAAMGNNPYSDQVTLVVGVPGLINQRSYYSNKYYEAGTPIVNIDDDIYDLRVKISDKKAPSMEGILDFDEVVASMFDICENQKARLWGIYAANNALFMKNTVTVGLRYICGAFHGNYAGDPEVTLDDRASLSSGEDFENTLRSFNFRGKVVRCDFITMKTKYFAEGGIEAELRGDKENRRLRHAEALVAIASKYPDQSKTYEKAGGVTNIRLKTITEKKLDRFSIPALSNISLPE